MTERLRDADYIADRLGVPRSWVYRAALPSVRCGRYRRFAERDIERWIDMDSAAPHDSRKATVSASRRSYGTGTLYHRADAQGRQWWYGRWHNGTSRPNRKIGSIRTRGGEEGLTRREAEQALRKLIESEQPKLADTKVTVAEAGDLLLRHLEAKGLKPTTLGTYDSALRTHLYQPPLGELHLHAVARSRSKHSWQGCALTARRQRRSPTRSSSSTRSLSSAKGNGGAVRTRASSSTLGREAQHGYPLPGPGRTERPSSRGRPRRQAIRIH
jgi:hypothetical protein